LLKVGLTGGIGCGKSTVAKMFVSLGAHVIDADSIAKRLMEPGQPVYESVVLHFGREILDPDGSINRQRLADAAFGSPENPSSRVKELNRITHPAVVQYQDDWMAEIGRREPNAVVMVEAALIIEAGAQDRFDRIVLVTCALEARVRRWVAGKGGDPATARKELERRIAAQLSDEEKRNVADYVIDNSGAPAETERQVREVYDRLCQEAPVR
jgi:dephospho-CoA kinase